MSLEVNVQEEEFKTSELHNSIQKVAELKGVDEFEYNVEFASERSDSFAANIFRVLIKDTGKNNNFSVIVKTLVNAARQELFQELHKREVFVYQQVFPIFKAIQDNIDENQRVVIPEFLYFDIEKGREILILEDLTEKGFTIDGKLERFEQLDYLQVRLVMSELAKLNGLSFVLQCKDPEHFKEQTILLQDLLFNETFLSQSKLRNYFSDSFSSSVKVIVDEEAKTKLQKIEPQLLDLLRKHVQLKKYNVLCHGDCWINNVLFKHEIRKDSQICFIDFQAMRYANPATDIVYFLYLCTDSVFRREYFDALLTVYYESLKLYLRQYGINVKHVYPKEDFENDVFDARTFGLAMALINLRMVTTALEQDEIYNCQFNWVSNKIPTNNDTTSDIVPENNIKTQVTNGGRLFILRVNDVVNESIENGVLDKLICEINK